MSNIILAGPSSECFSHVRIIFDRDRQFISDTLLSTLEMNGFVTNRGLPSYGYIFTERFIKDLNALQGSDHWIDFGTGEAIAPMNYLGKKFSRDYEQTRTGIEAAIDLNRAKVTGVAYTRPDGISTTNNEWRNIRGRKGQQQFRYLEGRLVENIPNSEIGQAKLITDLFGPLAYTKSFDLVLQKYLDILTPDGVIYFHIALQTEIDDLPVIGWLRKIKGIKVEKVNLYGFRITKTTDEKIKVPKLFLQEINHELPPFRSYHTHTRRQRRR